MGTIRCLEQSKSNDFGFRVWVFVGLVGFRAQRVLGFGAGFWALGFP